MQLVHAYNKVAERNDASLFHYGFVQDLDPPLLAALDTPSGNLYDPTTYTETDYGKALRRLLLKVVHGICMLSTEWTPRCWLRWTHPPATSMIHPHTTEAN